MAKARAAQVMWMPCSALAQQACAKGFRAALLRARWASGVPHRPQAADSGQEPAQGLAAQTPQTHAPVTS